MRGTLQLDWHGAAILKITAPPNEWRNIPLNFFFQNHRTARRMPGKLVGDLLGLQLEADEWRSGSASREVRFGCYVLHFPGNNCWISKRPRATKQGRVYCRSLYRSSGPNTGSNP